MLRHFKRTLLTVGCVTLMTTWASGATQALYLFDSLSNPTPDLAPYEELVDSSGNGRDLVRQENFGGGTLDTDRPAVMPSGTSSLNSIGYGTGSPITANTDRFSVGKTGSLSIEFWYKPQTTGLKYLMEFGNEGANGWDIYQTDSGPSVSIHAGFRNNVNSYVEMQTGAIPTGGNGWNHFAVTIDAAGSGKLYVNGTQVASQSYTPANFTAASAYLRLGAGSGATFSNTNFWDEMRISDTALLPGTGTGVGQLAWNASLAPEPSSLALLGIASVGMLRRCRRRNFN